VGASGRSEGPDGGLGPVSSFGAGCHWLPTAAMHTWSPQGSRPRAGPAAGRPQTLLDVWQPFLFSAVTLEGPPELRAVYVCGVTSCLVLGWLGGPTICTEPRVCQPCPVDIRVNHAMW
jgi:hypothetical protein